MKPKLLAAALICAAMMLPACTQNKSEFTIKRETIDGLPSVVATGYAKADVKVLAVDDVSREIALAGPEGKAHFFTVSPNVKRLDEIKAGDMVKVRYNSQLCMYVLPVGEEPSTTLVESMIPRDNSDKPGIEATRRGRIICNVESIDYQTRLVKLRPVSGTPIVLKASDKLKGLDRVHAGDQVAISYIEMVSINVD